MLNMGPHWQNVARLVPCSAWTVLAPLAMILHNLTAEQPHPLTYSLVHLSIMATTLPQQPQAPLWTSAAIASSQPWLTSKYERPLLVPIASAFSPVPLLSVHTPVPPIIIYHQLCHHSNLLLNRAKLRTQRKRGKKLKVLVLVVPLWWSTPWSDAVMAGQAHWWNRQILSLLDWSLGDLRPSGDRKSLR